MARPDSPILRIFNAGKEALGAARDAGKAIDARMCITCLEQPAVGEGKLCSGCADDVAEVGGRAVGSVLQGMFSEILKGPSGKR